MEQDDKTFLRETVTELMQKMGFAAEVEVNEREDEERAYTCMARVREDQNFLIGQYGVNLAAIQHLVRVIVRKKTDEKISVTVDVNDYLSGKRELLEKEAQKAAEEALQNNASVALRPMLPYERKIVHSFLSKNPSIMTESVGRGDQRKIMVSPRPEERE